MAAKDLLHKLRKGLIENCNKALVKDLLDDLHEERILSNAEVEFIDEGYCLTSDKMRALVDIVKKKGDKSCNFLIKRVSVRDPELSGNLGITAPRKCSLPEQEQNVEPPNKTAPTKCSLPKQEQNVEPPSKTAQSESSFPKKEQDSELPSKTAPSGSSLPTQEQKSEPPSQKEVNGITLCSKEKYESICSEEENQMYSIWPKNERTRLALIICNDTFEDCKLKERDGAKVDVEGMEKLLDGLGYKVLKENNLTVQEMRDTLRKFAAAKEHINSDSTFIVLMSHGHRDVICGTDTKINSKGESENVLHVDEIFSSLNNENCRALRDKPKVVIIQACRGNKNSSIWVTDSACDLHSDVPDDGLEYLEDDAMRRVQKESDFLCFCSSTPDTVSWRHPEKGSLFILCLIDHMKKDAYRFSIADIFRNVQLSFRNLRQMPTQERTTFLKKFFLFPGH